MMLIPGEKKNAEDRPSTQSVEDKPIRIGPNGNGVLTPAAPAPEPGPEKSPLEKQAATWDTDYGAITSQWSYDRQHMIRATPGLPFDDRVLKPEDADWTSLNYPAFADRIRAAREAGHAEDVINRLLAEHEMNLAEYLTPAQIDVELGRTDAVKKYVREMDETIRRRHWMEVGKAAGLDERAAEDRITIAGTLGLPVSLVMNADGPMFEMLKGKRKERAGLLESMRDAAYKVHLQLVASKIGRQRMRHGDDYNPGDDDGVRVNPGDWAAPMQPLRVEVKPWDKGTLGQRMEALNAEMAKRETPLLPTAIQRLTGPAIDLTGQAAQFLGVTVPAGLAGTAVGSFFGPGGAAVGGAVATSAAGYGFSMLREMGSAYNEFIDYRDPKTGEPIDPGAARVAAILYGAAAAGIELVQLDRLLGVGKTSKETIKKLLRVPAMREVFARTAAKMVWDTAKTAAFEGATEWAQADTEVLLRTLAQVYSGHEVDLYDMFGEMKDRGIEEAGQIAIGTLVTGGLVGTVNAAGTTIDAAAWRSNLAAAGRIRGMDIGGIQGLLNDTFQRAEERKDPITQELLWNAAYNRNAAPEQISAAIDIALGNERAAAREEAAVAEEAAATVPAEAGGGNENVTPVIGSVSPEHDTASSQLERTGQASAPVFTEEQAGEDARVIEQAARRAEVLSEGLMSDTPQGQEAREKAKELERQITEAGRPAEEAKDLSRLAASIGLRLSELTGESVRKLFDMKIRRMPFADWRRETQSQGGAGDVLGQAAPQEQIPADTSTTEFKKWFGESAVVNEDGTPMEVYHATTFDFEKFDPKMAGTSTGGKDTKGALFFTTSPKAAEEFIGGFYYEEDGKVKRQVPDGARIMPVYLKAENPLVYDFFGGSYSENEVTGIIKEARRDKHDSVILRNIRDGGFTTAGRWPMGDTVIVFSPAQIKSVNNRGTWDAENPNIYYQTGDDARAKLDADMGPLNVNVQEATGILTGSPVFAADSSWVPSTGGKLSDIGKNWLKNNPVGTIHVETNDGPLDVVVNEDSITNSLWHTRYRNKVAVLPAIRGVIENGAYLGNLKDLDGGDIENYYFAAPVELDGARKLVFVRVRQAPGTSAQFYVHEVFTEDEIKNSEELPAVLEERSRRDLQAPMTVPQKHGNSSDLYRSLIRNALDVKSEFFNQENAGSITDFLESPPNANIRIMDSWRSIITLFENADASSLPHEIAHHVLNILVDIRGMEGVNEKFAADIDLAVSELGVSREDFLNDSKLREEAQEKFARSYEVYLETGKAPTKELQGAYSRIRSWLINVYRDIRQALGVELSPEMSGFFDRLIATPQEITENTVIGDLAVEEAATEERLSEIEDEMRAAETEARELGEADARETRTPGETLGQTDGTIGEILNQTGAGEILDGAAGAAIETVDALRRLLDDANIAPDITERVAGELRAAIGDVAGERDVAAEVAGKMDERDAARTKELAETRRLAQVRLENLKQRQRAMRDEQAERRRARAETAKAVNGINRTIALASKVRETGKSISVSAAREILELAGGLDPHVRRQTTIDHRAEVARYIALHPEELDEIRRGAEERYERDIADRKAEREKAASEGRKPERRKPKPVKVEVETAEDISKRDLRDMRYAGARTLNGMTVSELGKLAAQFKGLEARGREEYAAFMAEQGARRDKTKAALYGMLEKTPAKTKAFIAGKKDLGKDYSGVKGGLEKAADSLGSALLDRYRLLNRFDNDNADYGGAFVGYFGREQDRRHSERDGHVWRRKDAMYAKLKDLGFNIADFAKKVKGAELGGHRFTADELMHIYIGMKNARNREAIINGNFGNPKLDLTTPEERAAAAGRLISLLTDEQKKAAELVAADFDAEFDRINEALIRNMNRWMEKEEWYITMSRTERSGEGGEIIDANAADAKDGAKAMADTLTRLDDGFTHSRRDIKDGGAPIELGLFRVWGENMERQEHIAAFAGYAQDAASAMLSRNPDDKSRSFGREIKDRFGDGAWTALVASENVMLMDSVFAARDSLTTFGKIGNNVAVTALAYNMATSLLQFSAGVRFLPYAGPKWLSASYGEFAVNPKAFLERAYALDPQLRSRAGDASYSGLVNEASPWYMRHAFTMMTEFDKWTAAVGFMATYNANIERGASQAEAVSEAQRAVAMTQNAVHPKDKPQLWKEAQANTLMRLVMIFTGDAAKRLNIAVYDLVQAARHPWTNRGRILSLAFGLAFEALLVKAIREGFPDDDDNEGWFEWAGDAFAKDAINLIPLIGGEAVDFYDRMIRGKYRDAPRSVLFSPFYEAFMLGANVKKGEGGRALSNAANVYAQALSGVTGVPLPAVALRRAFRGATALTEGDVSGALGAQIGHYKQEPRRRRRRRRQRQR